MTEIIGHNLGRYHVLEQLGQGGMGHVPRLDVPIATADSQAVAGVLTDPQYCGYPDQQVQLLFDQDATRQGILDALAALARRAGPDYTATIFYCGHGDYGTDGEYYLVSHDAQIAGDKVAAGSGVSQASLASALKEIQSKRLLVIFNTCHSGEISPTLGLEATLGDRSLPNATADALLSTGSGRVIITACREEAVLLHRPGRPVPVHPGAGGCPARPGEWPRAVVSSALSTCTPACTRPTSSGTASSSSLPAPASARRRESTPAAPC